MQDMLVNQVKKLIIGAIKRNAEELGDTPGNIGIWIYTENNAGYPKLKLMQSLRPLRELAFSELATKGEKFMYFAMGFNIDTMTPDWIQKFILRSAADMEFDNVSIAKYLLAYIKNPLTAKSDLHAFMYVNGKQIKEVELEYILETR